MARQRRLFLHSRDEEFSRWFRLTWEGIMHELLAVNIYLLVCCYAPIKLAQKLEISIELECEGLKDLGRRVKDINFHNLGGVFHWGRTFHGE